MCAWGAIMLKPHTNKKDANLFSKLAESFVVAATFVLFTILAYILWTCACTPTYMFMN